MTGAELRHYGVVGMKWGKRRYQNEDGSLTSIGQKRLDKEKNTGTESNANRWVKEDLNKSKRIVDTSANLAKDLNNLNKSSNPPKKEKLDLSKMSDQELRDRINRTNLELKYNEMFAPTSPTTKGQKYANAILDGAAGALTIGSSALAIALAIKELKS